VYEDTIECLCDVGYAGNVTAVINETTATRCERCPVGTYKDIAGTAECTQCGVGKFSGLHAATSANNCTMCAPEMYAVANQSSCAGCEFDAFCMLGVKVWCADFRAHSHTLSERSNTSADCICRQGYFLSEGALGSATPNMTCEACTKTHYCGGRDNRRSLCPAHSSSQPESVHEHDCVCHKGYFRHSNMANTNATECWPCKADTYTGLAQRSFRSVCAVCVDPRAQDGSFWQEPGEAERCNLCVRNASLGPPYCVCYPGSFLTTDMRCEPCFENHVCTGAHAPPLQCPAATVAPRAGQGRSTDDCVCVDGYFRADNREVLAVAIAQNIVQLGDSARIWCVLCPIGFYCHTPQPWRATGLPAHTLVRKCPALASTRALGARQLSQCECVAGAHAPVPASTHHRGNTTHMASNSSNSSTITPGSTSAPVCSACSRDHYCGGGAQGEVPCPHQTISRMGATSIASCFCLPPRVMLPTQSPDFMYDCVVKSMVAYLDSSAAGAMHAYNIFTVEARELYTTYATMSPTQCLAIETGIYFWRDLCPRHLL